MKIAGIIDIEASGLHFDAYPIEVAIWLRGECKSWLIKPEPEWQYWCDTAESLHGISRETLFRDGLPVKDVVSQLNAFLTQSDTVLYSDAHYWDSDWIDTLYHAANMDKPFYIDSIYELIGNDNKALFDQCFAQLVESGNYQHHRAAGDVRMLYEAYCRVIAKDSL